ncbi:MAG: redoxin domain-containing protein [Chloroflexi bacterium]|nr:redoxin domain-containing protein [Chloroflexota bacterium]
MAQLRHEVDEFLKRGAQIVVVGPEEPEAFARYFQENDLPFIGLPDPRHGVLKQFGQEVNLFKLGRMPAQVVVDRQGTARFIHYGHSMEDIPSNGELFEVLDSLAAPAMAG